MQSPRTKKWVAFALVSGFFLLRLVNLNGLPAFSDEAINIHRVKLLSGGFENLWITFEGASKKPLTLWLTYPFYGFFIDPLVSCRFASVLFGFAAFLAAFLLATKLFNWNIAAFAALIYLACPFTVFFERIFFQDHLVSFFAILFLLFLIRAAQDDRLKDYVFSGLSLGLAALSKETALLFLIVPLFAFRIVGQKKLNAKIFLTLLLSVAIPFGVALTPHLRFGTRIWHVSASTGYLIPLDRLLSNPFPFCLANVKKVLSWYLFYLGPLVVVVFIGVFSAIRARARMPILLLLCGVFVPLVLIFFADRWYSRYILFAIPPLLIFSAWTIVEGIKDKFLKDLLIVMTALYFLLFDTLMIFSPSLTPLAPDDREQYVTGWASGYGFNDVKLFFEGEAKDKKIDVFLPPILGHPTDTMFVYFGDNENVSLHLAWWLESMPILRDGCVKTRSNVHTKRYRETICFDDIAHAYFVIDLPQFKVEPILKQNPDMKVERITKKPEDKSAFVVFKLR